MIDLIVKNVTYLDVFERRFKKGDIAVSGGSFCHDCGEAKEVIDGTGLFAVPSFIDGHIHIESSLVPPAEFAGLVIPHGTGAVIADPHEIVNVLGSAGMDFMLENSKDLDLDVFFAVPSCVPASPFDESGGEFGVREVKEYLKNPRVVALGEMMNYPGVLVGNKGCSEKIAAAKEAGKVIDGHAPCLSGEELKKYVSAGIDSDHECTSLEEAKEKYALGQWIMIREGTASKNLETLIGMFDEKYADRCLLVTDDIHAGDILKGGHIDGIIRKAIALGAKPELCCTYASYNAARRFGLKKRGAISEGYTADFVLLSDLESFTIEKTFLKGREVFAPKLKKEVPCEVLDTMHIDSVKAEDFKPGKAKVIGIIPRSILTEDLGYAEGISAKEDILALAVCERHKNTGHMGKCYLKGYGLKRGAVATSISHDSHNIIAVGENEEDMAAAVNAVREMGGGMAAVSGGKVIAALPLKVGGIMSELSARETAELENEVKAAARKLGVYENVDPFMTLSFMALSVIPRLKLTTLGVVDVDKFELI